jgi:hypothetical protein
VTSTKPVGVSGHGCPREQETSGWLAHQSDAQASPVREVVDRAPVGVRGVTQYMRTRLSWFR